MDGSTLILLSFGPKAQKVKFIGLGLVETQTDI